MTEKEYRKHPALNYSKLKDFDKNRYDYYRKHVLKDKIVNINQSMILGSLVDCLLLEPQNFSKMFTIASCSKPTGQMGEYVDELYTVLLELSDENGEKKEKINNMMQYAFERFKVKNPNKFKGKDFDYLKTQFSKKDSKTQSSAMDYFLECVSGSDTYVIDQKLYDRAEKIKNLIAYGKYSGWIFQPSRTIETYTQKPLLGNFEGVNIKGLLDIIVVNNTEKTIKGIDLKNVWSPDDFNQSFLKMGYYLQASMYHYLLKDFAKSINKEDYKILPFEFLVCDTTLETVPHFYECDEDILKKGLYDGFVDKYGNFYKSVKTLIEEIEFCTKNNSFNDTLELNSNNGKLKLKI